jgi:hypothetical protein
MRPNTRLPIVELADAAKAEVASAIIEIEQFQTVLAALRERLDDFVSIRMRRAAAEAGHIRPRRPQGASSPSPNAR